MDEPQRTSRALRAVALIAAAVVAVVAVGVVYLKSTSNSAPRAASTAPSTEPSVNPGPMYWLSANIGWVVLRTHPIGKDEVTLYHTTDGGHHWQRQFSFVGFLTLLRFFDSGRGVMAASPVPFETGPMQIYRTDDGGTHWRDLPVPDQNAIETFFVDPQHGWLVSGNGTQSGGEYLTLYRTIDGGQHWVELLRVDAQHRVSGGISEASFTGTLTFVDALHGWLGAARPDGSGVLYVTHDGGGQWLETALPAPPGGWLAGATRFTGQIVTSPDGHGTLEVAEFPPLPGAQLPRGWVFVTMDGGASWKDPVEVPAFVQPGHPGPTSTLPLRDFFQLPGFTEGRNGWLATQTAILTTGDSGRTWQSRGGLPGGWACRALTPVSARVSWCEGVPPDRIILNGRWELFRTIDGGRHWQQVPKPPIA